MTGRPSLRFLALITGIALSGCTYGLDLVPEEKGLPRLSRPVAQEILRSLQEREPRVTGLQAVLDLTVRREGTLEYRQEAAAIRRPDLIRLESIGWGGFTSLVIVSDGRRLIAHALLQNLFVEGSATPENVARVTGFHVAPAHLVRLLLGLPPLAVRLDKAELYGPDSERAYLLREQESPFTQRLWLADDDLSLLRGELYDRTSLRLRFRYAPAAGGLGTLFLEEPVKRTAVEVSYRSYTLNPELPHELFHIPQPSQGARVVDLDTGAAQFLGLP
jgi:outer membrane lipoprotein-sorting protein